MKYIYIFSNEFQVPNITEHNAGSIEYCNHCNEKASIKWNVKKCLWIVNIFQFLISHPEFGMPGILYVSSVWIFSVDKFLLLFFFTFFKCMHFFRNGKKLWLLLKKNLCLEIYYKKRCFFIAIYFTFGIFNFHFEFQHILNFVIIFHIWWYTLVLNVLIFSSPSYLLYK